MARLTGDLFTEIGWIVSDTGVAEIRVRRTKQQIRYMRSPVDRYIQVRTRYFDRQIFATQAEAVTARAMRLLETERDYAQRLLDVRELIATEPEVTPWPQDSTD